ncbi:MAG: hypothetical protein KKH98_14230, partial [Spirochaetes bacterium]|nr:hypothetical protein [Spirochaetota bacterium]
RNKKYKEYRERARELIKDKVLTLKEITNMKESNIAPDVFIFKRFEADDQKHIIKMMDKKEVMKYSPAFKKEVKAWYIRGMK